MGSVDPIGDIEAEVERVTGVSGPATQLVGEDPKAALQQHADTTIGDLTGLSQEEIDKMKDPTGFETVGTMYGSAVSDLDRKMMEATGWSEEELRMYQDPSGFSQTGAAYDTVEEEWKRGMSNIEEGWEGFEEGLQDAWGQLEEGWGDLSDSMGGAGGAGDVTENAPWGPLQPYLKDYYAQVGDWSKDPGGVAGPTSETQQAWDLTSQRALEGSPLTGMAQGTMARGMMEENPALAMYGPTARGDMMDQDFNKFFQRASKGIGEEFRDVVLPSVASRFGAAGRAGSGAEKEMTDRAMSQYGEMLGNIGTDIYGQERGRQQQAIGALGNLWGQGAQSRMGYAGMAPGMAAADYSDIGRLAGVGEQKRGYEQQQLDQPYVDLERQSGLLQPGLGFSQTKQPTYGNQDLNTALSLASIWAMF